MRRGKKGHVLNACDTLSFAKKKKAPSSNVREAKGAESRAAEGRRELCQRDAALSWQEGTSATTASLCLFFLLTVAGLSICVRVGCTCLPVTAVPSGKEIQGFELSRLEARR